MKYIVYGIKILIITLLALYSIPYTLYPVYAVDSTPSADIKTKVEQFIKEAASKAAQLKKELVKNLQNRAYVGKIKTKSSTAITIASKNGPRIVNINQDTEFSSQVKLKKYSQKLISEEDYIAALGDIDENQVLTAKKIILLPQPQDKNKIFLWGQIVAISDKLVTIKNRDLKNTAISLPASSTVKLNDFVILTGVMGKNEIFSAEFVYIIPQGGFIKPKKIATPSASVASSSAKKK